MGDKIINKLIFEDYEFTQGGSNKSSADVLLLMPIFRWLLQQKQKM